MTRRFQSKITKGFAAIALLLALVVSLAVANSRQFRHASREAMRVQETLRELEEVLSTMVDAETGMRGYVLSGEERFLEPYNHALATIDGHMANLRRLLHQTSVPDGRLPQLEKAVNDQLAFRRGAVEKVKTAGASEAVRRSISIDEGKRGMDIIRRIIDEFERAQEEALAERRYHSEVIDRRSMAALIAFVALTIALLICGLMLMRHHLAMREKLEAV